MNLLRPSSSCLRFLLPGLLLATVPVFAGPTFSCDFSTWQPTEGKTTLPGSDAHKAGTGFGAAVIITPESNWLKKWADAKADVPVFATTDRLKVGEHATILIFYANALEDVKGMVNVTCDIRITRPNGTVIDQRGRSGYTGQQHGAAVNTYLAETNLEFVGEPTDPLGVWTIEVTVHDNNRDAAVPLKTVFTLEK